MQLLHRPTRHFRFFSNNLQNKTGDFSGFQTQMVGVEGKHADHLITTMAQFIPNVTILILFYYIKSRSLGLIKIFIFIYFRLLKNSIHQIFDIRPLAFSPIFSAMLFILYLFLKNGPIPASFLFIFVLFTFQFKWQIYNLNNINWKKRRWCAWDSNPGPQDGRCRQIHWAMAAPLILYSLIAHLSVL